MCCPPTIHRLRKLSIAAALFLAVCATASIASTEEAGDSAAADEPDTAAQEPSTSDTDEEGDSDEEVDNEEDDSDGEVDDEEEVEEPAHRVQGLSDADVDDLHEMRNRMASSARDLSGDVSRPLTVEEALRSLPMARRTPAMLFRWISQNIEFEPYPGSMRGAEGALITGRANSIDMALLAHELLTEAGHNARFVTGSLHEADTRELVERTRGYGALSTPDGSATMDGDEIDDPDLRPILDAVQNHVWLEVDVQNAPRPFDPIAAPEYGVTPAMAEARHDELPGELQTTFQMRMISEDENGRTFEHLVLDGPLSQVAFRSITLSFADDPVRPGGYKPHLTVGAEQAEGDSVVADSLVRLALEFRFRSGRQEHRWQQVLYRRGQGVDIFEFDHQHFAIAVAPGPISDDKVRHLAARGATRAAEAIEAWIEAESAADIDVDARRDHANASLDAFGSVFPYAFTRLLDRTTDQLGANLGVHAVYPSPRVLTAGLLRDGDRFHLDVQIDGDRIRAIPRSDIPPMAATAFLGLYGMIRDDLTSEILAAYGDHDDTTVRHIFDLVTQQSPRVTTIYSANLEELDELDIGDNTREVMRRQIRNRDMVLLTPTATVDDGGIERFGWWALTPHRGNMEGHRADALLTAEIQEDPVPVDSRPLIEEYLRMLARHYQAAGHATDEEMRFPDLACSAANLYREMSRVFCAESEPLATKPLRQCFGRDSDSDSGGGLIAFTQVDCADLVAPTRCGASYAAAVLGGDLGVVDESTSTPLSGLCR